MKVKEYECYKAFYCGLCRTLKQRYGFFSTFFLSYDAVLPAILYNAFDPDGKAVCFEKKGCVACPFKRQVFAQNSFPLLFSADALMLMTYFKLRDSLKDRGFFERLRALVFYPYGAYLGGRAKKFNPILFEAIKTGVQKTGEAEKASASFDAAADGTAYMMGEMFSFIPGDKEKNRRLGYLLGRFIYLVDAADDLEDDIKKGNFNPFKETNKEEIELVLKSTVAACHETYAGIEVFDMRGITDNLIFDGLVKTTESILKERKRKKNERSV
jgi:hypothetical protein